MSELTQKFSETLLHTQFLPPELPADSGEIRTGLITGSAHTNSPRPSKAALEATQPHGSSRM
jgi:hypothetical protein